MSRILGLSILAAIILLYCTIRNATPKPPQGMHKHFSTTDIDLSSYTAPESHTDILELSDSRLEVTQHLCDIKSSEKSKAQTHRLVLWTKSVGESARKTLHTGFQAYRISSNGNATEDMGQSEIETRFPKDSDCWSLTNLPRITHPHPPKTRPQEIMFGVASTKDRLLTPHSVTSKWLQNSQTNFYMHVPKNDLVDAEEKVRHHYRDFNLSHYSAGRDTHDIDQTLQYARLSATMYELSLQEKLDHVQWFVHLDDDTLLTSVDDYARMLDAYDPALPIYIGAHSESAVTMARDGRGAWGGASIAVSRALAAELSARWLECTSEGRMDHSPYGDHKLDGCVAHLQGRSRMQPDIKLEHSLHQLDFFGSIDGYLRSGVKWLTLHHFGWVNLFPYPDGPGGTPAKVQKIWNSARVLGADGLFTNYLLKHTNDGATVLTNGYAITQYVVPMTRQELETVEKTFMENVQDDYNGAVGPTRPPKKEGLEKRTFFVDSVKPREVNGVVVGSTWTYKYDRDGVAEDIIVEWLL